MFAFISCSLFAQPANHSTIHNHQSPAFKPNHGQWEGDFSHLLYTPRYEVYLTPEGFKIAMSPVEALKERHDSAHENFGDLPGVPRFSFSWNFIGHHSGADILDGAETGPIRNYFFGSSDQWVTALRDVKVVSKNAIYPGIDVVYKVHPKNHLEYDFIVAPNADPSQIKWNLSGVEVENLGKELVYETPYGLVKEIIPEAYQMIDGRKVEVEVEFAYDGSHYGFDILSGYNSNHELIIDPVIVGATLTGSTGENNFGHGATYDQEGNIFSYGIGFGPGLPTTDGVIQEEFEGGGFGVNAVISKFNPDASEQIFATYLGKAGTNPHSASTNLFGDLYIFGTTDDQEFPVTPGCFQDESGGSTDIFISRLSPDGTELIASTYLGGSSVDGVNSVIITSYDNLRGEISLDFEGNVYVASTSRSADFPINGNAFSSELNGPSDGICARLTPDLSVLSWSTFLGGDQDDSALNVRVAENGNVVFSGSTRSLDYPATPGAYQVSAPGNDDADAVLGVLSPDGSELLHATYVGTSSDEQGYFMDLDNDDNVWIYGRTLGDGGNDWPITDSVFTTDSKGLFVTKLNSSLSEILTSTAIGPDFMNDFNFKPVAFLVDRCDRVYISSFQAADGMPLTDDALFTSGGFYLAAFEDDLETLSFATYYSSNHVDGGTSRFDKKGIVYQGVCSGGDFNTTNDAFATDQFTSWDVGVFKIDFQLSGVNAAFSAPSELDGCAPHEISFSNFSVGDVFEWDFGDGTTSSEFEPTHVYEEPGVYTVNMIASDSLSCNLADTVSLTIDIFSPEDFEPSFDTEFDCETNTVSLLNTTGGDNFLDFFWIINGDTLYTSYNANHQFQDPGQEQTLSLLAVDEGCELDNLVTETFTGLAEVQADISNLPDTDCTLTVEFENTSNNATEYIWDFGDGNTSTEINPTHTYSDFGEYEVSLTAINPGTCNGEDQVSQTFALTVPPPIAQEIDLTQTGPCGELQIVAEISDTENISALTWLVNDEEAGADFTLNYSAAEAGTYDVTAEIIPVGCLTPLSISDTITAVIELPIDLGPDRDICYYESSITLENNADLANATYIWTPGDIESPQFDVSQPGLYTVNVSTGSCTDSRTIEIGLGDEWTSSFEKEICEGQREKLTVPVDYRSFNWENGSTTNSISISRSGIYRYTYIDQGGCEQEGEYVVTGIKPIPDVYIPNSFTPNGDGINDIFKPSVVDEMRDYAFKVYNRWGQLVFDTNNPLQGWNGSDGTGDFFAPPGAYAYQVKYRGVCQSETIERLGTINLIR